MSEEVEESDEESEVYRLLLEPGSSWEDPEAADFDPADEEELESESDEETSEREDSEMPSGSVVPSEPLALDREGLLRWLDWEGL